MKKTMKQHSFTTRLTFFAVVFGIAMAFASCANEDVAQNSTNPNDGNDKNLTTFVAGDETKTRTSMDYNSGDFYWEAGDYIYVKDDDGTWQKSTNAPASKVATFRYKVPGKFTASTSYKVYYLGSYSSGNAVTISSTQYQTSPDNTEHFGFYGDYGSATATKVTGKQQFSFTLEHQPAYLVFQPYTSNTILKKCYLTKIEVTSDNDIAETYTINTSTDNLDASAGGKQIVLTTGGWSSSNPNGFPLTNSSANRTTNGAYMVIKPGTHILKVRYWIKDLVTQVEGTITKLLPSTAFASNTYYDVTANLDVRDYDGDHYYMWDAQQQYWYGYEWTKHLPAGIGQPTISSESSSNYPQNNSDPRYWNESFPGYYVSNPAVHAPCKDLPNVNEMTWYAMKGDPHWDGDELWTTMGHLYKGGMWFLKKDNISGYRTDKGYDNTYDYRISNTGGCSNNSITPGLPSASEANKYFYMPALGTYNNGGKLEYVGNFGYYWSSSAHCVGSQIAFALQFHSSGAEVSYFNRYYGHRTQPLVE